MMLASLFILLCTSRVQAGSPEGPAAAVAVPPVAPEAPPTVVEKPLTKKPGVEEPRPRALVQIWRGDAFRDGRRLEGAEFYDVVGRPDLAASYRRKQNVIYVVQGTGALLVAVAGVWAGSYAVSQLWCHGGCKTPAWEERTQLVIGAAGIALLATPLTISPDPLTEAERRALADRHNQKLRAMATRVAPFVTPQGGGFLISGRF